MKTQKGYKVRLYPNKKQVEGLNEICGCTRFVWNYYLEKRKYEYLRDKKTWNYYDCSKDLTQLKKELHHIWLGNAPAIALQQSLRDLDVAYNRFFRKQGAFPKFKSSKNEKQSFRKSKDWYIQDNKIRLTPDLTIKFRGTDILGELKSITIICDNDKWYASILSCQEINPAEKVGEPIGIDLGIKDLIITSEGKRFENIRPKANLQSKIRKLQQSLSRKQRGSKNREHSKLLLTKLHKKISNQRLNHLHQTSHRITSENQALIVCEDLSVKNMMQNHILAGSIGDVAWAELLRQLEYKQIWRGGKFKKIDRFFPSSKTCSNCHHVVDKLPLSIRSWGCPMCGIKHDRDINAAKNILVVGLSDSLGVESNL